MLNLERIRLEVSSLLNGSDYRWGEIETHDDLLRQKTIITLHVYGPKQPGEILSLHGALVMEATDLRLALAPLRLDSDDIKKKLTKLVRTLENKGTLPDWMVL